MFSKRFVYLLALLAVSASTGCGTMANLEGRPHPWQSQIGQDPPTPFGGVRKDVGWIKSTGIPGNLLFMADLPISLVGDLVTLPKTVTSGRADPLLRTSEPGTTLSPLGTDARADFSR
jgi:hypothetical protein